MRDLATEKGAKERQNLCGWLEISHLEIYPFLCTASCLRVSTPNRYTGVLARRAPGSPSVRRGHGHVNAGVPAAGRHRSSHRSILSPCQRLRRLPTAPHRAAPGGDGTTPHTGPRSLCDGRWHAASRARGN